MFAFLKKYMIAMLFVIFTLMLLTVRTFQTHESSSKNTLIIGLQSGYPPFEFMNSKGEIVGFDVDLAKRIAEKLGKNLVIKDMEFEGEILSLKQGKIDLILSGMNITPSRLKEISMVPYHGESADSLSLIFWNSIPAEIHTLEDLVKLDNPMISVESGTIPEGFIERFKDIQSKSFQGALAPLMDVKYGKSAANLVEPDVAKYLQKQHPEIKILDVPLPKDEAILGFGIGIKKENQELYRQIQLIIQELKDSGEIKELEQQWFKGEEG